MGRTLGAIDKVLYRKTRSDLGKKRKLYMGKKPKGKRQIKSERKKGDKQILKLWIWEKVPMSESGRLRWNKRSRPYANPYVFPGDRKLRIDMRVEDINNKQKMEQMVVDNMYVGTFYVMGFSHGKNKWRVKPVKLCEVVVKIGKQGNYGTMINNFRLSRYWFWEK